MGSSDASLQPDNLVTFLSGQMRGSLTAIVCLSQVTSSLLQHAQARLGAVRSSQMRGSLTAIVCLSQVTPSLLQHAQARLGAVLVAALRSALSSHMRGSLPVTVCLPEVTSSLSTCRHSTVLFQVPCVQECNYCSMVPAPGRSKLLQQTQADVATNNSPQCRGLTIAVCLPRHRLLQQTQAAPWLPQRHTQGSNFHIHPH